ncbi:S41 family peptidase [Leptolyngbya sp. 15MV]|nr:S41 family peptidase [Leptolyngbya sp. 15MV]
MEVFMRWPILLAVSPLVVSAPLLAQSPTVVQPAAPADGHAAKTPFVQADAQTAVTELAAALHEFYIYPDPGKAYATMLRAKLASGEYANFSDAVTFAKTVTADLQAVHADGHLRLQAITPDQTGGARDSRGFSEASSVTKAGWIAPGVAYIAFNGFPGNDATLADVTEFLASHQEATTLIIDERGNRGGGLAEMNLVFSQIYPESTELVAMDTRQAHEEAHGSPPWEGSFMRKVAGPEGVVRRVHDAIPAAGQGNLAKAKVYLLVSQRTASAGEHLALALKRTGRATLIGESTSGANHFGGIVPMGEGFLAFVPVGRTFDQDTGADWEGTGVKPDIEVPADEALDRALELAKVSVSGEVALSSLE